MVIGKLLSGASCKLIVTDVERMLTVTDVERTLYVDRRVCVSLSLFHSESLLNLVFCNGWYGWFSLP